jgi:cobalt-precorrin-5B (C1)-methyltransferase
MRRGDEKSVHARALLPLPPTLADSRGNLPAANGLEEALTPDMVYPSLTNHLPAPCPAPYKVRMMDEPDAGLAKPGTILRRGWTTGACAAAAAKAAMTALLTGQFPDPVSIVLPKGERPAFPLALESLSEGSARAGIIKDAGDDPDVTHGATIIAEVAFGAPGSGIVFAAGEGVGTVTRAGLPIPPGEPAINPVPRQMISAELKMLCRAHGRPADVLVTISVPNGAAIAEKTWNPRLGIIGGLSILGTTGIVHPFSCAAWIHSIHRGVDVARAAGLTHVAGSTGSTSEAAVQALYSLPDIALIDMGDFAGGLLKYLRVHPIDKVTIAGGFAKITKLAQGAMDLHSARSQIDLSFLAKIALEAGLNQNLKERILKSNTAQEALEISMENGVELAKPVALLAQAACRDILRDAPVSVEILITDRKGTILARQG